MLGLGLLARGETKAEWQSQVQAERERWVEERQAVANAACNSHHQKHRNQALELRVEELKAGHLPLHTVE